MPEERSVFQNCFGEEQQKIKSEARESCVDMDAKDNLSTILSSDDFCGDDI
jgi:hypothetical protein